MSNPLFDSDEDDEVACVDISAGGFKTELMSWGKDQRMTVNANEPTVLKVFNIPMKLTEQGLKVLFQGFGLSDYEIIYARRGTKDYAQNKKRAILHLNSHDMAHRAVKALNNKAPLNLRLIIEDTQDDFPHLTMANSEVLKEDWRKDGDYCDDAESLPPATNSEMFGIHLTDSKREATNASGKPDDIAAKEKNVKQMSRPAVVSDGCGQQEDLVAAKAVAAATTTSVDSVNSAEGRNGYTISEEANQNAGVDEPQQAAAVADQIEIDASTDNSRCTVDESSNREETEKMETCNEDVFPAENEPGPIRTDKGQVIDPVNSTKISSSSVASASPSTTDGNRLSQCEVAVRKPRLDESDHSGKFHQTKGLNRGKQAITEEYVRNLFLPLSRDSIEEPQEFPQQFKLAIKSEHSFDDQEIFWGLDQSSTIACTEMRRGMDTSMSVNSKVANPKFKSEIDRREASERNETNSRGYRKESIAEDNYDRIQSKKDADDMMNDVRQTMIGQRVAAPNSRSSLGFNGRAQEEDPMQDSELSADDLDEKEEDVLKMMYSREDFPLSRKMAAVGRQKPSTNYKSFQNEFQVSNMEDEIDNFDENHKRLFNSNCADDSPAHHFEDLPNERPQYYDEEISSAKFHTVADEPEVVYFNDLEPIELLEGSECFFIEFGASSDIIYIKPIGEEYNQQLDTIKLERVMWECFTMPRLSGPPEVGQVVAAPRVYYNCKKYIRVVILKVSLKKGLAKIRGLDYLYNSVEPLKKLRSLPADASRIPSQEIAVKLEGTLKLPPKDFKLVRRELDKVLLNETLVIDHISHEDGLPLVRLSFNDHQESVKVNYILSEVMEIKLQEFKHRKKPDEEQPRRTRSSRHATEADLKEKLNKIVQRSIVSRTESRVKEWLDTNMDKVLILEQGLELEVNILTWKNKTSFFMIPLDLMNEWMSIVLELESLYNENKENSDFNESDVKAGKVFLGPSKVYQMPVRALVLDRNDEIARIFCLDFGSCEKVSITSLKPYCHRPEYSWLLCHCVVGDSKQVPADHHEVAVTTIRVLHQAKASYIVDIAADGQFQQDES